MRQFFGSLTGYLSVSLFLLLNWLFLFVVPDRNVFDGGYATMDGFFDDSPWILLMLIPAITMRSFSEEFRTGTYETLRTRPVSHWTLIGGKYIAALLIVCCALLPTLLYPYSLSALSSDGVDGGGIAGSYIGLFLLAAAFTAIGIWCSSLTANALVSFLLAAFICFASYVLFDALSGLPVLTGGGGYLIGQIGMESHYRAMSRGVVDSRDVVYFLSVVCLFLALTARALIKR